MTQNQCQVCENIKQTYLVKYTYEYVIADVLNYKRTFYYPHKSDCSWGSIKPSFHFDYKRVFYYPQGSVYTMEPAARQLTID